MNILNIIKAIEQKRENVRPCSVSFREIMDVVELQAKQEINELITEDKLHYYKTANKENRFYTDKNKLQ